MQRTKVRTEREKRRTTTEEHIRNVSFSLVQRLRERVQVGCGEYILYVVFFSRRRATVERSSETADRLAQVRHSPTTAVERRQLATRISQRTVHFISEIFQYISPLYPLQIKPMNRSPVGTCPTKWKNPFALPDETRPTQTVGKRLTDDYGNSSLGLY